MGAAEHAAFMGINQRIQEDRQAAYNKKFQFYLAESNKFETDLAKYNSLIESLPEQQSKLLERKKSLDITLEQLKREEQSIHDHN